MMCNRFIQALRALFVSLPLAAALAAPAAAQEKVRIGIIGQFSGPFAQSGQHFRQGVETYMAQHGTKVGGREVEVIYRDVGGSNPAVAKRLAEELIVRDKVSLLGGFFLSPEASAAASVVTETKTPAVIFNAAASPILRQSPYFVRVASTIWQDAVSAAEFAHRSGKRRAYIAVGDYAPGHDVQQAFKARFTALGGQVIGEDRVALNTVDFSPAAERIANAKPDVVQVFFPSGAPQVNFVKSLAGRGLVRQGTMVIGLANDTDLPLFDDSAVGYYSVSYYAPTLDNPENRKFKEALKSKFGASHVASFLMVGAYDGMHVLYRMIESQKGKAFDGGAAVQAVRGLKWASPRGPATIDAESRDIVHNEYIRRIEKVGGRIDNAVVHTFADVKDPWALANPLPAPK
jgi:branched-chain amino acid transport system substrate-binding protein